MIPKDDLPNIRSVKVSFDDMCVLGFSFHSEDGTQLFDVGVTNDDFWRFRREEAITIEQGERIVGVVAKIWDGEQSCYTDF